MQSHHSVILRLAGRKLILCKFTGPAVSMRHAPNSDGEYGSETDHYGHDQRCHDYHDHDYHDYRHDQDHDHEDRL